MEDSSCKKFQQVVQNDTCWAGAKNTHDASMHTAAVKESPKCFINNGLGVVCQQLTDKIFGFIRNL